MARGVAEATLRVWAPQGAQVLFVSQVSPTVEDLTARRHEVNPLTGGYPTGAWGDEARDYHVAVRLPAKSVGQEQLAARVQLAVGDAGRWPRAWSRRSGPTTTTLTTRIDPAVAHYTGQAELAAGIQDGLAAKAAGDDDDRDGQARAGRAARRRDRQRGGHQPAAQGRRHRRRRDRHRAAASARSTSSTRWRSTPLPPRRPGSGNERPSTCPQRARRPTATDYCDVCGVPIAQEGGASAAAGPGASGATVPARWRARRRVGGTPDAAPDGAGLERGGSDPGVSQLPDRERLGRAVLRGVRIRLHDRALPRPCRGAADSADDLVASTWARGTRRSRGCSGAAPARGRRPRHPSHRRSPSAGWPRSGSTPHWYASQETEDPCRHRACPRPCRCGAEPAHRPAVVSRGIHPDIDLGSDPGVSRRQAQLTTDGSALVRRGPRVLQRHLCRLRDWSAAGGPAAAGAAT